MRSPPDPIDLVVLDPAHGGAAASGSSSANRAVGPLGTLEKDVVLDLAQRVRAHLASRGIRARLTREADTNPSLADRAATARTAEAAGFVSIHVSAQPRLRRVSTWVHDRATPASLGLAERLHERLVAAVRQGDGGVRAGTLAVLDPAWHAEGTAACVVDLPLFADEATEARWGVAEARDALTVALAEAIDDWLRAAGVTVEAAGAPTRPGACAVVVGIDRYGAHGDLSCARADATALAGWLVGVHGIAAERVALLLDGDATSERLRQALAHASARAGDEEVVLAFAGRGRADPPALVCADGVAVDAGWMSAAAPGAGTLHVLSDAGLARSATFDGRSAPAAPLARLAGAGRAVRWVSATRPGDEAWEHRPIGHGLFTRTLLDRARFPDFTISEPRLVDLLAGALAARLVSCGRTTEQRPWRSCEEPALFLSRGRAPAPVEVRHWVPLVAQQTGMSCWAAGAAMLVGWRDRVHVDGAEVARGSGRWAAYEQGLAPDDIAHLARAWGLRAETRRLHRVDDLAALMREQGPLWIGEADPDLHVVVLYGVSGDGTPDGTDVAIADPWPVGKGERYTLTFRELMTNFRLANELVGFHAQILHTGGRPPDHTGSAP